MWQWFSVQHYHLSSPILNQFNTELIQKLNQFSHFIYTKYKIYKIYTNPQILQTILAIQNTHRILKTTFLSFSTKGQMLQILVVQYSENRLSNNPHHYHIQQLTKLTSYILQDQYNLLSYILTTSKNYYKISMKSALTPSSKLLIFIILTAITLASNPSYFQIIIAFSLNYCNFCLKFMNQQPVPQHIRTIKYKVKATITTLKIQKKTNFFTKVNWKRHQNQASTTWVHHQNQFSVFNQDLQLCFSFHYDTQKHQFLQKRCDMIVTVDLNGDGNNIKNGGYVRFDISEPLNQQKQGIDKKLILLKNPDPDAYIEFSLFYQPIEQIYPLQMSTVNISEPSLSQTELSDSQLKSTSKTEINSVEDMPICSIGDIVTKFQYLSKQLKERKTKANKIQPNFEGTQYEKFSATQKILFLQRQLKELIIVKQGLELRLQDAEYQKKDLERLLDKKSREILLKSQEVLELGNKLQLISSMQNGLSTHNIRDQQLEMQCSIQQYKKMQSKLKQQEYQLSQLKEKIKSYQKLTRQKSIQNMFGGNQNFGATFSQIQNKQKQRKDFQLQSQLADKSNKIGQLFNAAFEIGGASLLDKLQNAIGLVETR